MSTSIISLLKCRTKWREMTEQIRTGPFLQFGIPKENCKWQPKLSLFAFMFISIIKSCMDHHHHHHHHHRQIPTCMYNIVIVCMYSVCLQLPVPILLPLQTPLHVLSWVEYLTTLCKVWVKVVCGVMMMNLCFLLHVYLMI